MSTSSNALFPPLSHSDILAFQFSAWYPTFSGLSIKSTVIRPLGADFRDYLDADSVFVPKGSEDVFVRLLRPIYSSSLADPM